MARRKTTTRRRRTAKPMINAFNAAQTYVIANAVLQGTMGVNPVEFLTGRTSKGFKPGSDGFQQVTLPELVGFGSSGWSADNIGGVYGSGKTFMDAVQYNLKTNGGQMFTTLLLAPVGFAAAKRLLGKPLINPANRLLKSAGLSTVLKI